MKSYTYGKAYYAKTKQVRRIKRYLILGGVLLFLVGIWIVISQTSLFHVQKITASDPENIDFDVLLRSVRPQIASTFLGGLLGPENYFAWSEDLSYSDLNFSGITIEKSLLTRSVNINATPRKRFAVWCAEFETSYCYWVDQEGYVFDVAPQPQGQLIPAINEITSATSSPIYIGAPVLPIEQFERVRSILTFAQGLAISIDRITMNRSHQELHLKSLSGAVVMFSLRFNPATSALPALKKLSADQGLGRFEYIDLTAENRALVKLR